MKRIEVPVLRQAMRHALQPYQLTAQHVSDVIDTLVETSLNGVDTHGVRLLETYVKELEGGRCKAHPQFRFTSVLPAVGLLDAGDALGVVAANEAMRIALKRTRTQGISAIAVANSNHCGAIGYYSVLAARAGMLGLSFTNSDALVAPFNGAVALNGTNPIGMAAPGIGDEIFALDMSTSQTSFLKALRAMAAGNQQKHETRDKDAGTIQPEPTKLVEPLQPLGGYKGQGLGMMVQILSAVLTNMPFDYQLSNMYDHPYDTGRKIGHLFICIDIQAFCALPVFRSRMTELLGTFRTSLPAGEATAVSVPGDLERRARRDRLQHGIQLSEEAWCFFESHVAAIDSRAVTEQFS